jgi:uncharacterized membrane protein YjjP (DUF1212 family)
MKARARSERSLWRIFRWPLAFALLSMAGLISALVGDGAWNVVSWACLVTVAIAALKPLVR